MLPHSGSPSQLSTPPADTGGSPNPTRIGVGIDTARYGHYAVFLRADLQPAAADLAFAESGAGYAELRTRLEQIAQRHAAVAWHVRIDAAGQYADNLQHFLHFLAAAAPSDRSTFTLSLGDPQRNKNYRAAIYGSKKSDPTEAAAAARFALTERPAGVTPMSTELRTLRQVAGRLQATVRQRTRLINQFHKLLALVFPELALLTKDVAAGWVLELVHRFPTARRLAAATPDQLQDIPYLAHDRIDTLLTHARTSVASLHDAALQELIRDQVRQLRDVHARQKRLENTLIAVYRRLPQPNHLDTIPGIGPVTAAVLTAFILDIDRFETPGKLVAYFGILPIEAASGIDRDGKPRGPKRYVMSKRGNDLVRRYLWMAGLCAVGHNPAVRPLYARVVARHPQHKAIAIGHAMRKLLHLAFAVWKSGKPFDPEHYPWGEASAASDEAAAEDARLRVPKSNPNDMPLSPKQPAAGLTLSAKPAQTEVTAAGNANGSPTPPRREPLVDFDHLKKQLPMTRLLDHLGLTSRLKGAGLQKRCTCPIHRGDARGRTFSVHLGQNVFQCFDKACRHKGDVIDLWAALHGLSLRQAAVDLLATFQLEAAPPTEKRNG